MKKEEDSSYYDKVFATSKNYAKVPEQSPHYPIWKVALDQVKKIKPKYIIDLGCGPGHFEELLVKDPELKIEKCIGYDFSQVALNQCSKKIKNPNYSFKFADLTKYDFINDLTQSNINLKDTIFVSYEFLEHINDDLLILSRLPAGVMISFSVPSYDARGHVRYFNSADEVYQRYNQILDISKVNVAYVTAKKLEVYVCVATRKLTSETP